MLVVLPFWTNYLIRTYAWIVLLNRRAWSTRPWSTSGSSTSRSSCSTTAGAVVIGLLYAYLPLMILPLYASIERLDPQLQRGLARTSGARRLRAFLA